MNLKAFSVPFAAIVAAVAGCMSYLPSVGPDYEAPSFDVPASALPDAGAPTSNLTVTCEYRPAAESNDSRVVVSNAETARWWTRFDDEVLVELVEGAVEPSLHQAPHALNPIGICLAVHIELCGVIDTIVDIALFSKVSVAAELVCVDHGSTLHTGTHKPLKSELGCVARDEGTNPSAPFNDADNRGLAHGSTPLVKFLAVVLVLLLASHIGLVNLHDALQEPFILARTHGSPDTMTHEPSGLLSDVKFL